MKKIVVALLISLTSILLLTGCTNEIDKLITVESDIKIEHSNVTSKVKEDTLTKTGATFKGWYKITETNLGQKCNVLTPFTNETVLTAVFDVNGTNVYKTYQEALNMGDLDTTSVSSSTSGLTGVLTSGSTIKYCAEDDIWPTTNSNKTVEIGCPINYIGKQSRTCDSNGEWKDVNSSGCIMQCPTDGDWDATEVNKTAEITSGDCILTRECGSDGKWGDVQTDCGNSKVMPIILLIIGVISILIGFFIKQYIIIGIGIIVAVI